MPVTDEHIETATAIARDYGATRMVVFGSALDDPENARDLDLAIEGVEGWTIWKLAAEIEENLDIPVDVIPLDPSPFTELVEEYGREIRIQKSAEVEERFASNWTRSIGSFKSLQRSTKTWEKEILRLGSELRPESFLGRSTWASRIFSSESSGITGSICQKGKTGTFNSSVDFGHRRLNRCTSPR